MAALLPFLAGSLFAIYGLYRLVQVLGLVRKISASASWPATTGTVTEVRIGHHGTSTRGGRHYWVEIDYHYSASGADYQGTFKKDSFWGTQATAQRDAGEHPVGAALRVQYDPGKPVVAVASPERVSPYDLVVAIFFLFSGSFVGCPAFLGLTMALSTGQ